MIFCLSRGSPHSSVAGFFLFLMKWACLGHLSEDNNTPALALATHRRILGDRLPLFVASRYEATDVMEI
jgi:hypothetical protein